jgi:hypothetical protein
MRLVRVALGMIVRMLMVVMGVAVRLVAMMVRLIFPIRARLSIVGCHPATSPFVTFMLFSSKTLPRFCFHTTLQATHERRKPSNKMAPR